MAKKLNFLGNKKRLAKVARNNRYRHKKRHIEWLEAQGFSPDEYAARSGVEDTISQAVVAMGMRRTRYRGQAKTHLQHVATAAAINRIIDWLNEKLRSKTRVSHFSRLQFTA